MSGQEGSGYSCAYNLVHGNDGTLSSPDCEDHLVQADPLFTDAGAGDFTLQAGSPAIDAGDPDPLYLDPDGTWADIGAYGGPEGVW